MALVACFAGVREMNSAEMGRASRARLRRGPTEIDIYQPPHR
jgi:hypothetical protein